MKLHIIHELGEAHLKDTINFLKENMDFEEIQTCHISKLEELMRNLSEQAKANPVFLTLHLDLKNEISSHMEISKQLSENNLIELNPYSKAAELAENKHSFYNLMLANGIKQAKTQIVRSRDLKETKSLEALFPSYKKLVIKPCHGTESRGLFICDAEDQNSQDASLKAINKILEYDECLIQEYMEAKEELRIIIALDKTFVQKNFLTQKEKDSSQLKNAIELSKEILEILNYELPGEERLKIIAIDFLLGQNGDLIPLEANLRPAALFKSQNLVKFKSQMQIAK